MLVDELSGAVVLTRCKATSVELCAACARLYEGDAKQIVRSGVSQRLERDQVITFLTLTAPPMWRPDSPEEARRAHRFHAPYWKARRSKGHAAKKALGRERSRAICASCTKDVRRAAKAAGKRVRSVPPVIHGPDDPVAGLPVDPDAFDYPRAAEWNWELGERWKRTMTYLERELGRRPQYLRAREVQRRGLAHLHVLVEGRITRQQFERVVKAVNESYPDPAQGWGTMLDVQHLTPGDDRLIGRITAYVAKYVTKHTAGAIGQTATSSEHAREHMRRFRRAALRVAAQRAATRPDGPCPQQGCPGALRLVEDSRIECRQCHWQGLHRLDTYQWRLGIRCQPITKSRHWAIEHRQSRADQHRWLPVYGRNCTPKGLTFTTLRHQRARYAAAHNPRTGPARWIWVGSANRLGQRLSPKHAHTRPPERTPADPLEHHLIAGSASRDPSPNAPPAPEPQLRVRYHRSKASRHTPTTISFPHTAPVGPCLLTKRSQIAQTEKRSPWIEVQNRLSE